MFPCRLFVDPPRRGVENMALDEALLDQAADEGLAALRFYQWSEPTLSLGYFQRYADRELHPPSRAAAVVRRLSGGGALVHDREVTYCLCLPAAHPRSRTSAALYGMAHRELIAVLAELGIGAHLYGPPPPADSPQPAQGEPFLCFARRTAADVVLASGAAIAPKIVGSAQRRRRGAVLQHGAVLLERSPSAPELPGVFAQSVAAQTAADIVEAWSRRLAQQLELQLDPAAIDEAIPLQLRKWYVTKHASRTWIKRR
jgi:lipoate-protein ligase A